MDNKIIYGCSIKGNSHFISGTQCQDSNSFDEEYDLKNNDLNVICLSDGHGGAPYYRSKIGSDILCKISKKIVLDFLFDNKLILDSIDEIKSKTGESTIKRYLELYREINNTEKSDSDKQSEELSKKLQDLLFGNIEIIKSEKDIIADKAKINNQNELDDLNKKYDGILKEYTNKVICLKQNFNSLKSKIINEWHNEVEKDLQDNPVQISNVLITPLNVSEKEKTIIGYSNNESNNIHFINSNLSDNTSLSIVKNYYQLYGATLLCVANYKNHYFVLQIGDGDIVVISNDGQSKRLKSKSDELIGNETFSVCNINAEEKFDLSYINDDLKMIMISCDGVSNALEDLSELESIALQLYQYIETEPETFRPEFKSFLRQFSNNSGDDCTLCFIANHISDSSYDKFVTSKDEVEQTELENRYKPLLNQYKIDNLISKKENYEFDILTNLQDIFESVIEENDELITKLFNNQKLISDDIKAEMSFLYRLKLQNVINVIKKSFDSKINNYISKLNIYIIKGSISNFIYTDKNFQLSRVKDIYGYITFMSDNDIYFHEINEDEYSKLKNIESFVSAIKLKVDLIDSHSIVYENESIKIL